MKTNAGYDWEATTLGNSAASGAGTSTCRAADQIAVTANATAPSATDTTLTGEITTASGGLIRKAATYAHTTSASTYTLTVTLTANGSDALPVTLAKMAVFNAVTSGGTMPWESLFASTATIAAIGDAVTITETITM